MDVRKIGDMTQAPTTETNRPATLPARVHYYFLHLDRPDEAIEWDRMSAMLTARGYACFAVWAATKREHFHNHSTSDAVDIQTNWITNNQWNTAAPDNRRVFDWYRGLVPNEKIAQGHYLDLSPELLALRETVGTCGYCGKHYEAPFPAFCDACIDSSYLKVDDLRLTRVAPAGVSFGYNREPLTADEYAIRQPLYVAAQIHGTTERGKARIAKQRADIAREYETAKENAKIHHDGLLWMLDHGINTDNAIFYKHIGRWNFGWRNKLDAATISALLDVLCEFPFDYDIEGYKPQGGK